MPFPKITELFDLSYTLAAPLLQKYTYPHEALPHLADFIRTLGKNLSPDLYERAGEDIYIAKSAKVAASALIEGPTVICEGAEIRHCAYIRGSALIGRGAVVGNSCEIKNAVLFDLVQAPHYNYVGDSILGYRAHMGAGAIASNFRSDKQNIRLHADGENMDSHLRKVGAFLGDLAEIGCGAVLCPGVSVGRNAIVYPLVRVRGTVPPNSILKDVGVCVPRR